MSWKSSGSSSTSRSVPGSGAWSSRSERWSKRSSGGWTPTWSGTPTFLHTYALLGGYEFEQHCAQALGRVELPAGALDKRIKDLSGGQRVKVGLDAVLASQFQLYLLDEPTNNLDLDGIEL